MAASLLMSWREHGPRAVLPPPLRVDETFPQLAESFELCTERQLWGVLNLPSVSPTRGGAHNEDLGKLLVLNQSEKKCDAPNGPHIACHCTKLRQSVVEIGQQLAEARGEVEAEKQRANTLAAELEALRKHCESQVVERSRDVQRTMAPRMLLRERPVNITSSPVGKAEDYGARVGELMSDLARCKEDGERKVARVRCA
jgi:hypothetical protein